MNVQQRKGNLFEQFQKKEAFSACRYGRQLPETFTKESGILT